jgi:hypothetical protein
MKKILRTALVTTLGAIGLAACDPAQPPNTTVAGSVAEAIPEGETLADLVREALADVVRDQDTFSRARRLGALLPTLGPELVPTVVETLKNPSLDLGATDFELLVRYWATHQPENASRWAVTESPTTYRSAVVFSAVTVWAEVDPEAAVDGAWNWAFVPTYDRIVPAALVRGWFAANDPHELAQWVHDLPVGIPRQRAIAAYVRVVIQRQGAETAKRWAESLPDDEATYKLAVFRKLVTALSKLDIEAGLRWCDSHCGGPYGDNMRSLIARSWVVDDGPSALAWLSSASEGYERDHALRLAFAKWGRTDPNAALDWMATQTTGEPEPWLWPIYPVYAKLLAAKAPVEAIQWAERIKDDTERVTVLVKVARIWRYLDEAAAEDWLLQSSLSEEAREQARGNVLARVVEEEEEEAAE